ncbi:Sel1 repeat protein, partial [Helicobacter pylori]
QALNLYKKGCFLKEGSGCHNVAVMYYTGKGAPKDLDKAISYYKKGCTLGFSGSCKVLEEVIGKKSDDLQDDAQNDTQDDTQ